MVIGTRRPGGARLPAPAAPATGLLVAGLLASGCEGSQGSRLSSLQEGGPFPFVRCLAQAAGSARRWSLGSLHFTLRDRVLRIEGVPVPSRLAVYSGPAFGDRGLEQGLRAVRSARPDLALQVGGPGDTPELAERVLALAAQGEFPTLVLAGARDRWDGFARAARTLGPQARARLVDISSLRAIRLGRHTLVPVAGAVAGRYALHDEACGASARDLAAITARLGFPEPKERRWLLAWQAPSGAGRFAVAATERGLNAGSSALASLSAAIGARGGLFAWPHHQVGRPAAGAGEQRPDPGQAASDLRVVVPRIAGASMVRDDGTRLAPGFLVLRLDSEGLAIESVLRSDASQTRI
ncbi:MAG: hypothetical protein MJD61_03475 [Proteobacteria bacterium]|nr:hypothetical protein [Pseudomonadota bacterium]